MPEIRAESTEARVIQAARGMRLEIKGALSEQDVLEALEQAALELRSRNSTAAASADAGKTTLLLTARPSGEAFGLQAAPDKSANTSPAVAEPVFGPVSEAREEESGTYSLVLFPKTLLWEPPLANPLQPRMYALQTTLRNANTDKTTDTAIGGTAGILRYSPVENPAEGFQLDFFAVVFSRWAGFREAIAADYRIGAPCTFAWGNWQAKIGYEHTSTHLGDQFIEHTGRVNVGHVRDEAVIGLAYRLFDQVRLYGVFGYAFRTSTEVGSRRTRFNWGAEWSKQQTTDWKGQPFAAFDMELRSDQDFTANMTTQIGWQWKELESRIALRLALQYYDGDSPYGQFYRDHERWLGGGVFFDF